MAQTRLLVRCDDYNGHRDVLFMMRPDDSRIGDGYETLAEGTYRAKRNGEAGGVSLGYGQIGVLAADGRTFIVYSDWSLGQLLPS